MVAAYTLTHVEQAIGIVRAAAAAGLPVAISFTVETDGRLPSEEPLREAVERLGRRSGAFPSGRGWFRTSDLSRVKQGRVAAGCDGFRLTRAE
jgi:hypothetical protein